MDTNRRTQFISLQQGFSPIIEIMSRTSEGIGENQRFLSRTSANLQHFPNNIPNSRNVSFDDLFPTIMSQDTVQQGSDSLNRFFNEFHPNSISAHSMAALLMSITPYFVEGGDDFIDFLNQFDEEPGPKGLSDEIFKSFHRHNHDSDCAICLESNHKNAIELPCKHYFHEKCIGEWFKKSTVCPLCKTDHSKIKTD